MRVVIIGSGLIGRCWSVIFARAQHEVFLFDTIPSMLDAALVEIDRQLEQLAQFDLLYNQKPADIRQRVRTIDTNEKLNEIYQQGIDHIQECVPEELEIKTKLFLELDQIVPSNVLIASSSSCIMPSKFTEQMKTRHRCIVASVCSMIKNEDEETFFCFIVIRSIHPQRFLWLKSSVHRGQTKNRLI